jgi:uncharacterized protein
MLVAIVSDIHDNLLNLKKCLREIKEKGIEVLVCCGDVTNADTLEYIAMNFNGPIHLVRGNMEIYDETQMQTALKAYPNLNYYGRTGRFEINGKFIGICHEPFLIEKVIELGKCDYIFYGHTHKPWIEEKEGTQVINPGTLGGVFTKGTYAMLDTEKNKPELVLL